MGFPLGHLWTVLGQVSGAVDLPRIALNFRSTNGLYELSETRIATGMDSIVFHTSETRNLGWLFASTLLTHDPLGYVGICLRFVHDISMYLLFSSVVVECESA